MPGVPPRVTIALAVRDAAPLLLRCLSALARIPEEIAFEVVVVDDASTDATPVVLEHVEGDLVVLRNERAIGWGPSCDRAVEAAGAEAVVLLSADAVPVDGWLEPLLAVLDRADGAGAVRPRAVGIDGRVLSGPLWPCLAVRRAAYERTGGFAAASRPGRADKASLVDALEAAGWQVVHEPASLVLVVPPDVGAAEL